MLTNKEKIDLRERAIRLSLEIPNPLPVKDRAMPWAEEIYQFLSMGLDDDPLRLDVPSPKMGLHEEIDWSRPQLVEFTNSDGDKTVLETSGEHFEDGSFVGRVPGTEQWYGHYNKCAFKHHGEIHATQEPKTTGLNFLEAIMMCNKEDEYIRRGKNWGEGRFLFKNGRMRQEDAGGEIDIPVINVLANDWEVVKYPEPISTDWQVIK